MTYQFLLTVVGLCIWSILGGVLVAWTTESQLLIGVLAGLSVLPLMGCLFYFKKGTPSRR